MSLSTLSIQEPALLETKEEFNTLKLHTIFKTTLLTLDWLANLLSLLLIVFIVLATQPQQQIIQIPQQTTVNYRSLESTEYLQYYARKGYTEIRFKPYRLTAHESTTY